MFGVRELEIMESIRPTCPRCVTGFVVVVDEYNISDPSGDVFYQQVRCVNCGHRSDAVVEQNKKDPDYSPRRKSLPRKFSPL